MTSLNLLYYGLFHISVLDKRDHVIFLTEVYHERSGFESQNAVVS